MDMHRPISAPLALALLWVSGVVLGFVLGGALR